MVRVTKTSHYPDSDFSTSPMVEQSLVDSILKVVDRRADDFIHRLAEAVAIPSVSADPSRRADVVRMVEWTKAHLERIGAHVELKDIGDQVLHDGSKIKLPPIIFGQLGNDPNKKTLLVYGHLDVQPASIDDGWNTDPFKLTEIDGKLFGRGSTDDKGPAIGWINAIEVLQELNVEIPLNIKFVFEGMEESGSVGLDDALKAHKDTFLKGVSFNCISDNYWFGKSKPCLTHGLRGINYFFVEVQGPRQDLHSGSFGGAIYEPMNDLVWVLSQLTDVQGNIQIPGLADLIAPLTAEEKERYSSIHFDPEEFRQDLNVGKLTRTGKEEILLYRWRYPSLSIHGIEGAFHGPGAKTVIPAKVTGKFSIRTVPNMEPHDVDRLVVDYLRSLWPSRGSPNSFKVTPEHSGRTWLADCTNENFQAGARATRAVHGVDPDYTREGGSIPVTLTFQELTGKSVLLLPVGRGDDMAHSQNEKLNRFNYVQGVKLQALYILELANAKDE